MYRILSTQRLSLTFSYLSFLEEMMMLIWQMEAVIILIINYWGYELNMEMPQYESSLVVMLQILSVLVKPTLLVVSHQ